VGCSSGGRALTKLRRTVSERLPIKFNIESHFFASRGDRASADDAARSNPTGFADGKGNYPTLAEGCRPINPTRHFVANFEPFDKILRLAGSKNSQRSFSADGHISYLRTRLRIGEKRLWRVALKAIIYVDVPSSLLHEHPLNEIRA
jgi:hypothetical protein